MNALSFPRYRTPKLMGEGQPVQQLQPPTLGLVIGAGQHINTVTGKHRYDLSVLDLDNPFMPMHLIPMNFLGHGISADPLNPHLLSVFEKRGAGACEIDLNQGCVTRTIQPQPKRQFYGHGAYSADGQLLYSTETIMEGNFDGVIAVRDVKTHDYLGEFPSYGVKPHDCQLIDDGKTLVISNGGGPRGGDLPSITYVDIESQQLKEKLEFDTPTINAGHLQVSESGGLAVVSAQREGLPDSSQGGITLKLADGRFSTLKKPSRIIKKLAGESLSVCIYEEGGIVGTTTPAGNLLCFWDLATGELIKHYELQNPRGITLSQNRQYFVVSFGFRNPTEALCLIATDSLEQTNALALNPTYITGSHLFSYTLR